KSEEEKRQEVESQMAALVVPGAPISVLMDHGLTENILDRLVQGGIGTVEKLGSMTPEQLESIEGIGPELVGRIQESVNSYYGQFETAGPAQEEVVQEHWNTPEGEAEYAANTEPGSDESGEPEKVMVVGSVEPVEEPVEEPVPAAPGDSHAE